MAEDKADIKSNNPHLTGGEQYKSYIISCLFLVKRLNDQKVSLQKNLVQIDQ